MQTVEIDLTQMKVPVNHPVMTPQEAAQGHDTVTMIFEKPVTLIIGNWDGRVAYPVGTHEVPRVWKDHWYLKAHGARLQNQSVTVGKP
jgi:hypothetical protein